MKDLSVEEKIELLKTAQDGVLAFSLNDTPYCIPFGFVYIDEALFLSFFPKGRKWECFQQNKKVCFSVYGWNDDHTQWSSVVVDGEIEQIDDMNTVELVVRANIDKMGLDPETYLDKRMDYYRKAADNPAALKTFKITIKSMGGKTMHTLLGRD
ncbi:MAG: hypothetical protein GY868_07045 [Deltaproteobacteria bacterium]|nr:hypothetical protein [Deltaproteobacteria bacterium]